MQTAPRTMLVMTSSNLVYISDVSLVHISLILHVHLGRPREVPIFYEFYKLDLFYSGVGRMNRGTVSPNPKDCCRKMGLASRGIYKYFRRIGRNPRKS